MEVVAKKLVGEELFNLWMILLVKKKKKKKKILGNHIQQIILQTCIQVQPSETSLSKN